MATYRGTIRKNDLEGGFWELRSDDGENYQIRGGDDALRVDGKKVEIKGAVDEDAMTIGMTGPVLDVSSWKAI
jgi:hypothetical protein